jgi:hypothetical protein
MPRRLAASSLVLAAALVTSAYAIAGPARGDTTIASASTTDFRVVLTAVKRGGGSVPEAEIWVTTSERLRGGSVRTGERSLRGSYFWKVVTGPRAVCRLEIRTTGRGTSFRPRAIVQLLLSPSLGCGPVTRHPLG